MKAADHTRSMLEAFQAAGVDRVDLAVRSPEGLMLWQRNRSIGDLPLAWLRASNVRCAEIYIRPARGYDWPLLFLDDVAVSIALKAVEEYGGLVVQTSAAGGCHVWLPIPRPLDELGRCRAQRWLANPFGADPASISGEHLGRLAGFKNWKRCGCWVNVLLCRKAFGDTRKQLEIPPEVLEREPRQGNLAGPGQPAQPNRAGRDTSPSGIDWAWVCNMLEAGMDPGKVQRELVTTAWSRRGPDTERYAQRTVERAMEKMGRKRH
jgi:hypothetical protein